jgi:hypothetical protein
MSAADRIILLSFAKTIFLCFERRPPSMAGLGGFANAQNCPTGHHLVQRRLEPA